LWKAEKTEMAMSFLVNILPLQQQMVVINFILGYAPTQISTVHPASGIEVQATSGHSDVRHDLQELPLYLQFEKQ
jgi:hypothetical protein